MIIVVNVVTTIYDNREYLESYRPIIRKKITYFFLISTGL